MHLTAKRSSIGLFICIGLLFLIWLTRLIAIDHFPPFVDETIHIHGAENARSISLFYDGQLGRQGTFWWMMLFQTFRTSPIWVARVVTVLALLPGLAALMAVARSTAGYWAVGVFGLVFLFSSYHLFFARLALADPIAGSAVMVAIYFASRLSRRRSWWDAVAVGFFLALGFIAKVNTVPFLGVPVAAALCLHPRGKVKLRGQLIWLAIALGTALVLIGGFVVVMQSMGQDVLSRSLFLAVQGEAGAESLSSLQRVFGNIGRTLDLIGHYLSLPILIALLLGLLVSLFRKHFFVALCLLAPMLPVWASVVQESRFLVLPLALLFLSSSVTLGWLLRRGNRLLQVVVIVCIFVWGALQWLTFSLTAANDPKHLPLAAIDEQQYLMSYASGAGYADAITFLQGYNVREVIGMMLNCQGFRYLAMNHHQPYTVICPTVNLNGSSLTDLANLLEAERANDVFVLLEQADYVPQDIPGTLLTRIPRPNGGPATLIYQLNAP